MLGFEEIAKQLLAYGPLGLFTLIALFVAWRKDKELTDERKEHQKRMDEKDKAHQLEMNVLEEKYVSKAETWMAKYHELSTAQNETIEELTQYAQRTQLMISSGKGGEK